VIFLLTITNSFYRIEIISTLLSMTNYLQFDIVVNVLE